MFLYEWSKNRRTAKEIKYIREWFAMAPCLKENRQILIPSENVEIKGLSVELNKLLDELYAQRVSYEHSRQAMMQVLTNISHDLRTPLTVLKGYSELLNREVSDMPAKEKITEMAIRIDSKANELVATINEYFTLSKITSGDMNMEPSMVNVTQICHEIILDYYDVLDERKYKVEIEISPLPEYAYVDTPALNRILKNLIDNAIKHGNEGTLSDRWDKTTRNTDSTYRIIKLFGLPCYCGQDRCNRSRPSRLHSSPYIWFRFMVGN